jgi:GNAT superfamily N-acetyltransferase
MFEVRIRPYAETDAPEVEALLLALWQHDPMMLAAYQMHRHWPQIGYLRQTLVAVQNGAICGAGTIFQSSFHPMYPYVVINVAPAAQRLGIGVALLARLRELAPGSRLLAKAVQGDTAGTEFLAKHGFTVVARSSSGLLDPAQPPVRHWLEGLPAAVKGFTLERWDGAAGTFTPLQIARVHAAVYNGFHAYSPLAALSDDIVQARFFGADVLEGSTVCVEQDGALCGAASLIRNPSATPDAAARPEAYLVNLGVTGVAKSQADQLTAALIRHSLDWAREHNYVVRFEADDTYHPHYQLFGAAPAEEVRRDLAALLTRS